jgi:prephenate dehydrogenase
MTAPATLVVGTGLIGTSVGIALRGAGRQVLLVDLDEGALEQAVRRGAGERWQDGDVAEHVVLAVPPAAVADELRAALTSNLDATVSDCSSLKSLVALQVDTSLVGLERFAGGHPMAGTERGGPAGARADLFVGRPWAITPYPTSTPEAVAAARSVASDCGAVPVELTPEAHDEAVGLVSHLPQVAASALAATVGRHASESDLSLVGQGLRDTTRLAASPAPLWVEILQRNREVVAPLIDDLAATLTRIGSELRGQAAGDAVRRLVEAGNATVGRLPGKHSAAQEAVEVVVVLLKDAPGTLAALLKDTHEADVNVEDIRIEHAPGAAVGAAGLVVLAGSGERLASALRAIGWSASVEPGAVPR